NASTPVAARRSRPRRPPRAAMITDTEFIVAADSTLAGIGTALEPASESSDADVDWNLNDGILEIECADGGKLIVNRHVANRELWVAARSGGFHYRPVDGRWRDTRSGDELGVTLTALIRQHAGLAVALPRLASPTM